MTIISNEKNKTLSPCIRNCCLDANDICVGCYRNINEIMGWREKSDTQKKAILIRCKQRKSQFTAG